MNFYSLTNMPLPSLFADLAARLRSAEFLLHAAHPDHPTAFTRQRKLPLPALVALMLSGMRKSIQSGLDEFFAHLSQRAQLVRKVSEQAFAQARAKLSLTAIPQLNDWLIERAEHDGRVGTACVWSPQMPARCASVCAPATSSAPGWPIKSSLACSCLAAN